ncbi:Charged multivesicular body protein 5 [Smittium culicis]|uniref:Charged multivesicular body protein 5 n=1 Tax=Smittium culicis TaxID=133412 RepID=A0A1R1Y874_9FUNG|nr:Charged multivesicular body protein 5 [Smittium culicis]
MNRFFGTSKPKEPAPTIDDAIAKADARSGSIRAKIDKFDTELVKFQKQLKNMREGPAKNSIRQRAVKVLQQKKMYESQLNQIEQQAFNMESAKLASENMQNTIVQIKTMEQTNKMLKKQYKDVDIEKIYKLQDEMADLLEDTNEIQELMGRSYNVPDDVNEQDLDAELEALEAEWNFEQENKPEAETPSYLDDLNSKLPSAGNINLSELDKELDDIANKPNTGNLENVTS